MGATRVIHLPIKVQRNELCAMWKNSSPPGTKNESACPLFVLESSTASNTGLRTLNWLNGIFLCSVSTLRWGAIDFLAVRRGVFHRTALAGLVAVRWVCAHREAMSCAEPGWLCAGCVGLLLLRAGRAMLGALQARWGKEVA